MWEANRVGHFLGLFTGCSGVVSWSAGIRTHPWEVREQHSEGRLTGRRSSKMRHYRTVHTGPEPAMSPTHKHIKGLFDLLLSILVPQGEVSLTAFRNLSAFYHRTVTPSPSLWGGGELMDN